mmetsp:Transcript_3768/g.9876  ORF Transcript_3768/g.9876 Transcript_3768/m.9876 type:complete len:574 (-) Transcript_3768:63-1784(-)
MFDPDRNSTDSDDLKQDGYSNLNQQQNSVFPTLSSSLSNVSSRKREFAASGQSEAGYHHHHQRQQHLHQQQQRQQQQEQSHISSIQGFPLSQPSASMPIRSNRNAHHGLSMGCGESENLSLTLNPSPSSLNQDLPSSLKEANTVLPEVAQLLSSVTKEMVSGNSTVFTKDPVVGAIRSSTNDPLQRLLGKSFPLSDGAAANNRIVYENGNSSDSNRNVMASESSSVISERNQFSTLPQQQSHFHLPPICTMSNDVSSTSTHDATFQLLNPPLSSNSNAKKRTLQNIERNSIELIRDNPVFQQQVAMMPDFNTSMTNYLTNVPSRGNTSIRAANRSIRHDNPFYAIPMSQDLMPNELIHLPDIDQQVAPTNKKFPLIANGSNTNNNTRSQTSASILYRCDKGRSKPLYLPCDSYTLSEYQCLLRKQIELFEATDDDIKSSTKGRNKPIFLGQVGVRCVHCRNIKPEFRARGATYYPATLGAMYQSGQTMAIRHLRHHCERIPSHVRDRLFVLKDGKSSAGGGKKYWSDAASVMGVYVSDEGGLKLKCPPAAKAAVPCMGNERSKKTKSAKEDPI